IPAQPTRGIWMGLSMDVDRSAGPHAGRMYVAFVDQADLDHDPDSAFPAGATDHDDTDVFVTFSDDKGVTWSTPVKVNDDDPAGHASQFFAWLDVDQSSGNVAVSWYDTRNDHGVGGTDLDGAPNSEVEYFAAVSLDGGQTWGKNVKVSDAQ